MALPLTSEIESCVLAEVTRDASAEEGDDGEQRRMRDLLASVQAQARLLPPVPPEQRTTGSSLEEKAFGEIVAEKYRKQGFNV